MQAQSHHHENIAAFDTDSGLVGISIDNRCSACISHVIEDFESPPRQTDSVIR